jgi:hypothetical protein
MLRRPGLEEALEDHSAVNFVEGVAEVARHACTRGGGVHQQRLKQQHRSL